jgi:putative hydrolase of the HAD superfamily
VPAVKAILFDADGVIQTAPRTLARVRALTPPGKDADVFSAEVFSAERPCVSGERNFAVELQRVLDRWGVDVPVQEALAIWEAIHLIPDVMDDISMLRKKGAQCYLATNQQVLRADYMRKTFHFDDLFDGAFYSYEMGAAKPDERYFEIVLSRLDLPASEVVFIDDRPANVAAAGACGLRALEFDATQLDSPGAALRLALTPILTS